MSLLFSPVDGQPVASSKQIVDNIEVFKDFKKKNLYYYSPGDLNLALQSDGKPRFQLLEMRYTGTAAYADELEKRFLNVVQFTVTMDNVNRSILKGIKRKLGGSQISLRPLPVKNVEAILVAPVEDNKGEYKRIGKSGGFQAEDSSGKSSKSSYWTERTFTLKLENHEAQLIWDQVETGHLSMSFGYTFYADLMTGGVGDILVSGQKSFKDKMDAQASEILSADTSINTMVVKSNAFPIQVDIKQWPDLLKKVDINEQIPPAYAALEVKCYDFTDGLRPDLALKTIEIQATGVGGTIVKLPTKKFLKGQPDLHTLQIKFPYAVKIDKPLRYKVSEYTLDGEKIDHDWVTKESWSEIIDITTNYEDSNIGKKLIEIEADPADWESDSIQKLAFIIQYSFNGEIKQLSAMIVKDESLPMKILSFYYDLDIEPICQNIWYKNDENIIKSEDYKLTDDYLYLHPPDN